MKSKHLSSAQGFSLVELLVVIAVIAIIAAIAIPNIANITSQATIAKNQRNAQNIVSTANAARAAGYTGAWGSEVGAGTNLLTGVTVGTGGQAMSFSISGLSGADVTNAALYMDYTAGTNGLPDSVTYKQTTN
ncbi:MAG: hypothetical protein BGO12_22570 [Verrucomicrobia bacterium 61-8]|mgnify:CR=1 FL=1|nr:prepilin-type N-terminal cleavage/methylation domain-containing protein [Verrucomicrobiota bacterium]OJU99925.1 MAG: hypothetical protein BGO12_22570 [Verrucomicrobia bacterium 61-8]